MLLRSTILLLMLVVAGCASAGPTVPIAANAEVDASCTVDSDCTVKDVGNCCGYYPACVNRDSPTFPDHVRAACAKSGSSSVCGFPEIQSCRCVQKRCAAVEPSP